MLRQISEISEKVTDYVASGSFASLKENVKIYKEKNYAVLVKTADFSNNFTKDLTYTDKHGYEFLKNSNLFGGELILSNIGSIGKVFIVPDLHCPMTLASNSIMIKPDSQHLVKYLYYFFISERGQQALKDISSGTSMQKFNKTMLKTVLVPEKNKIEQDSIVSKLDSLSVLINIKQNVLNSLNELIKSQFIEMFGDPDENPYNWEITTINDVCSSIVRGPFGSALKKEFFVPKSNTTVKVYEQQHAIKKNDKLGTYYVTNEKYESLKRFECKAGDILMSCSGTMGELYQLPSGCEKGIINQALCKFSLNDKMLPIVFLESMKYVVEQMDKKGSGIQNIVAVSYVKAMKLCLPPIDVQKRFTDFYNQIDKSKFIYYSRNFL